MAYLESAVDPVDEEHGAKAVPVMEQTLLYGRIAANAGPPPGMPVYRCSRSMY